MKIAICAQQNTQQALVDTRFGRCGWFAVFDDQAKQWTFIENTQNTQAAQGAGIQAAQFIIDSGAEILLSQNAGPKAMAALEASSIKVYQADKSMTVEQALQAYKDNKLAAMDSANVEGHWV